MIDKLTRKPSSNINDLLLYTYLLAADNGSNGEISDNQSDSLRDFMEELSVTYNSSDNYTVKKNIKKVILNYDGKDNGDGWLQLQVDNLKEILALTDR